MFLLLALFWSTLLLIYAPPPNEITYTEISSAINKTNLCENGGQLVVEQNFSRCQCLTGYVGKNCQFKDPCIENPCKNGGNCTHNINPNGKISLNCSCPEGIDCDDAAAILSCEENPCNNDGICVVEAGCICIGGFTGPFCEDDIDECQMDVCEHGECTNRNGTYSCECYENYYGKDCSLRNDGNNNCSCENGMRKNNTDDDRCLCFVGYTGQCCEVNIDDCLHHQCQHDAICIDEIANYTCQCSGNYHGRYCEDVLLVEHNQTAAVHNYNSNVKIYIKKSSQTSLYCKILLYITLVLFLITFFYLKYCIP